MHHAPVLTWPRAACRLLFLQVNQKLQLMAQGKWVDEEPEERRSPSPEPVYNEHGARTNTREQRAKDKLTRQRNVSSSSMRAVRSSKVQAARTILGPRRSCAPSCLPLSSRVSRPSQPDTLLLLLCWPRPVRMHAPTGLSCRS
jgi:hypothetical protein